MLTALATIERTKVRKMPLQGLRWPAWNFWGSLETVVPELKIEICAKNGLDGARMVSTTW